MGPSRFFFARNFNDSPTLHEFYTFLARLEEIHEIGSPKILGMDSPRNKIGLLLLVISLGLLVPGLYLDLMTLDISFSVPFVGKQNVHNETRSILTTIQGLMENGNPVVAFLILLFSVVVPVVKAFSLLAALLMPRMRKGAALHRFVTVISKWAMADVFVVGVFIAFLSTNSDDNITAVLHAGYYLFAAYCIVSIIAVQVIRIPDLEQEVIE